jgi:hypothetical protein
MHSHFLSIKRNYLHVEGGGDGLKTSILLEERKRDLKKSSLSGDDGLKFQYYISMHSPFFSCDPR